MLVVTVPFSGHGYDMPRPGTLIDPPEPARSALLKAGCVAEYEVKVQPLPAEVKKKGPSESLPVARAAPVKTRKVSAKKSKR